LGYLPPREVDGVFGEQTYLAVSSFQRTGKLTSDGDVGPQTWAALLDSQAPNAPELSSTPTTTPDAVSDDPPVTPTLEVFPATNPPEANTPGAASATKATPAMSGAGTALAVASSTEAKTVNAPAAAGLGGKIWTWVKGTTAGLGATALLAQATDSINFIKQLGLSPTIWKWFFVALGAIVVLGGLAYFIHVIVKKILHTATCLWQMYIQARPDWHNVEVVKQ